MIFLRYALILAGIALLIGAVAILVWDLYQIFKFKTKPPEEVGELARPPFRWHEARSLGLASALPILAGLTIAVVPGGSAGTSEHAILPIPTVRVCVKTSRRSGFGSEPPCVSMRTGPLPD